MLINNSDDLQLLCHAGVLLTSGWGLLGGLSKGVQPVAAMTNNWFGLAVFLSTQCCLVLCYNRLHILQISATIFCLEIFTTCFLCFNKISNN